MDDLHGEYNGHTYMVAFTEQSKGAFRWTTYVDNKDVMPMDDRPVSAEWAAKEGRSAAIALITRKYGPEAGDT